MPLNPPDVEAALTALHGWLEGWEARMPTVERTTALAWRRDGLQALYTRLEVLKMADATLAGLLAETYTQLGRARAWLSLLTQAVDECIGPEIENRAAMMVNRGMAAEERMMAHRQRAPYEYGKQRDFERVVVLLEGSADTLRTLSWNVRDERNDIRAQLRAINVAIEISEL